MKYFEHNHSNQLSYTFPPLKVSFSDLFSVLLKHFLVGYRAETMISMPQQITEIQLFFKGGLSGPRHARQSPL